MSGAAELVLPGVVKWVPVVGEDGMDPVWDGGDQAGAGSLSAVRRATFSCISTKASFDVRSIRRRRAGSELALRSSNTSAMSI